MTQIPHSIEQTASARPKRCNVTKLVVGLLAVFAVVCLYEKGHQLREGLARSSFTSSPGWPVADERSSLSGPGDRGFGSCSSPAESCYGTAIAVVTLSRSL